MIVWLAAWQAVASRLIDLKWTEAIMDIVPFLLITVALFTITHFATMWIKGNVALLIAKVVVGAVLYIAVMKIAKVKIFAECWDFIGKKFKPQNH